jgi:hypothetical protein
VTEVNDNIVCLFLSLGPYHVRMYATAGACGRPFVHPKTAEPVEMFHEIWYGHRAVGDYPTFTLFISILLLLLLLLLLLQRSCIFLRLERNLM